jgi:outer membrane usher protein FimD/PapC
MKMIRLSTFAIVAALSLAFTSALLAKEKDEDESASGEDVKIEKAVLAREDTDKFEPVESFKPNDTFAVLVFLNEAKIGTRLRAVWTIVDAGETHDTMLLEKKIELTEEEIKDVKEANRINFSLTHDDPYPPGDYKFEIYLNGELAKTIEFKINK